MMPTATLDSIALFYREGSSDKIYQAEIQAQDDGYIVTFQYGRRGSTLQSGTKTLTPVNEATARKIYGKLVAEKLAKGYAPSSDTEGPPPAPYAGTEKADQVSGFLPQLLNPINEDALRRCLVDDDHVAQKKYDGVRMLLLIHNGVVQAINRKGLFIAAPATVIDGAPELAGDGEWVLDGEAIGETYYAFDLLVSNGQDITDQPYEQRLDALKTAVAQTRYTLAPHAVIPVEKQALYLALRDSNAEGIVFKHRRSPYRAGRPNSGGNALKFKFVQSASVLCLKVGAGGKRSFSMGLLDPTGAIVEVGNCTIPANIDPTTITPGSILEVRYLYGYPGGALYQPVLLDRRDDLDRSACTLSQVVYKASDDDVSST